MGQYKIINGTSYNVNTPDKLIRILEDIRLTRRRVVFIYGDTNTGETWRDVTPNRGTVGRSTGQSKIPLLIRTTKSLGGESILDHLIVQIKESVGGKIIYDRKKEIS